MRTAPEALGGMRVQPNPGHPTPERSTPSTRPGLPSGRHRRSRWRPSPRNPVMGDPPVVAGRDHADGARSARRFASRQPRYRKPRRSSCLGRYPAPRPHPTIVPAGVSMKFSVFFLTIFGRRPSVRFLGARPEKPRGKLADRPCRGRKGEGSDHPRLTDSIGPAGQRKRPHAAPLTRVIREIVVGQPAI